MKALDERLVRRDRGLVQLLDPPFDKGDLNPGYIKGTSPVSGRTAAVHARGNLGRHGVRAPG